MLELKTVYAFPVESQCPDCRGMTLRDYFAAKAMQSKASNGCLSEQYLASISYAIADAMLAEREK